MPQELIPKSKKPPLPRASYSTISAILHKMVMRKPEDCDKITLEIICQSLIDRAIAGDLKAIEFLFNRMEGPPAAAFDLNRAVEMIMAADLDTLSSITGIPVRELESRRESYSKAQEVEGRMTDSNSD